VHPVTYEADYAEDRDRPTTFFRLLLAIPWFIVFIVYAIGSLFVTIIAWFTLLITARYPDALRRYNTGFLQYHVRVFSWVGLQTDEWPPFRLGDDDTYPVRVNVVAPDRQSRLKVFFRGLLALPAIFMSLPLGLIQGGAALLSWFSIVFRGYQPEAAHEAFTYAFTYATRLYAYYGYTVYYLPLGGMLVDDYPPLGDDGYDRAQAKKGVAAPVPPPPPPAEPAV
jgi:hypothetical protein